MRFLQPVFRPGIKITLRPLLLIFIISMVSLVLVYSGMKQKPHPERRKMIAAAKRVQICQVAIRTVYDSLSIEISDMLDHLQTGLIGVEFTPITTTLGDIEAKRVSTSPDFAALFVRWFSELNLQPGQEIIIHASASFPALILSAICAAEEWQLNPVILTSIGSSSFGANRPEFTWWDMENFLFQKRLIYHRTNFATPGGQDDNGSSLWEGGLEICISAAKRNGIELTFPTDFEQSVKMKWDFINEKRKPALFINIGGNQSGVGKYPSSLSIPVGLIETKLSLDSTAGLIHKFNNQNIPVIHLLNIRDIASENGLGTDIAAFNGIGQSDVYFIRHQSRMLTLLAILLVLGSWFSFFIIERIRKATSQDCAE